MPSNKGKAPTMNGQSPHGGHADSEKWKTSPSTETTSDEGENVQTEHERELDENAPDLKKSRR